MTKTARRFLSFWLISQILVSSVGFTLTERKCSKAEAKDIKEACCRLKPAPKKKSTTTQIPSCCNQKTFEEVFGEENFNSPKEKHTQKPSDKCCGDKEKEHNCCTFDAAYHNIAFKNYTISTKKHEIKQKKQCLSFVPNFILALDEWASMTTHAPPKHPNPPPKPSKHLLALYAIFLI